MRKMAVSGYEICIFQIYVRYHMNEPAKVTPPSIFFDTQLLIAVLVGSG